MCNLLVTMLVTYTPYNIVSISYALLHEVINVTAYWMLPAGKYIKENIVYTAFSIEADVRCYTSSILQYLVAYFIGRKSVGYFGFGEKVA